MRVDRKITESDAHKGYTIEEIKARDSLDTWEGIRSRDSRYSAMKLETEAIEGRFVGRFPRRKRKK